MTTNLTVDDLCKKEYNSLTLPSLMQDFIDVIFVNNDTNYQNAVINEQCVQNNLPFARSDVCSCKLLNAKLLAKVEDAKPIYEIILDASDLSNIKYSPGDTIGILPTNRPEEINLIIDKLGYTDVCDQEILISLKSTSKKPSKLPPFIPRTVTTIRKLLQHTLDLRSVLKKTFIRSLAEYTSDIKEKLFLHILCSKEGAKDYTEFILNNKICLLDLLNKISTCRPPFNTLLQNMTRLQPRPYSIANSPLSESNTIKIIFSISYNELRKPLTTTMLEEYITKFLINLDQDKLEIKLYFRSSNGFCYDSNKIQDNIIMVGAGTAVSPFFSFLEYRAAKIKNESIGTALLFAGHRYYGNNIYENELKTYLKEEVLQHLNIAFSREKTSNIKYVQDGIIINSKLIVKLLLNCDKKTYIYVCSGNKNMSTSIEKSFIEALVKENAFNLDSAQEFLYNLKQNLQYIEDIWF